MKHILTSTAKRLAPAAKPVVAANAVPALKQFVAEFPWEIREARMVRPQKENELAVGVYTVPEDKRKALDSFLQKKGFRFSQKSLNLQTFGWTKRIPGMGEIFVSYMDDFGVLCVSIFGE